MVSNNPVMNIFSSDFAYGGSPGAGFGGNFQGNTLGGWNMNSLFDMGGGSGSSFTGAGASYGNFDPFSVMGFNSGYGIGAYQGSDFSLSDPTGIAGGNGFNFDGGAYSSSILTGSEEAGMVDFQNYNSQYGVGGLLASLGVSGASGPVAPPSLGNYVAPAPTGGSPPQPASGSTPPAATPTPPSGSPPPAGGPPPAGSPPAGSPPPSGSVNDWIAQARKELIAAGVPADKMSEKDIATIIQHESSGDPNAVNNWDYNAQAGTPSQGLMQTIPSTFNAYKLPGHDNITNPVDNIIAGVRYAIDKYGSVSNVPGVVQVNNGGQYVGY